MKLLPIFLVVLVSATVSHALVVMVPKVDSETSVDSKAEPKVEVTEDAKDKAKDEVKDQTKDETKDEAESKTESKDKYWGPYGNDDYDGYGYYGRWRYNCRFCYYGNCPYYCYNYPMSEAVRPASTIPEYVANEAKVVVGTDASDKGVHYGYGYRPDAWDCICDPYYGCNCNDFPYQNDVQSLAETDSKTKTDSKDKWYPYGNRYCYYYPQFCNGGMYGGGYGDYPFQSLAETDSNTKTDSKGKWYPYSNQYCYYYPQFCYGGMYGGGYGDYPFQSLAKTDSKTKTDTKDKWYGYGNRYCDYYPEYCNNGGMYGGGYGGWYPYKAESLAKTDSKVETDSKDKWYPYGNRYCYYYPQFCNGGMYGGGYGDYPFQSLAKTDSKVETDSKDKWYGYGNRYCDYYPEYCNYGGMYGGGYGGYYPYQAESLATIDSKASTKSKGKYWYPYGNRYCRYNPQFCYGGMYGGGYGGYYPY